MSEKEGTFATVGNEQSAHGRLLTRQERERETIFEINKKEFEARLVQSSHLEKGISGCPVYWKGECAMITDSVKGRGPPGLLRLVFTQGSTEGVAGQAMSIDDCLPVCPIDCML